MASRAGVSPGFATADLCDAYVSRPVDVITEREIQIADPVFRDYGGQLAFHGPISTIRCHENNPLVRAALSEPGGGRVLVVDGGASKRCALLGDQLAAAGVANGWAGVVVNGCVRDSAVLGVTQLGVKALATHPLKSSKRDPGVRDVDVTFAGVTFHPGHWLYADGDGVLVAPARLEAQSS